LVLEINLDNNKVLRLVKGDITERNVDVIGNNNDECRNNKNNNTLPTLDIIEFCIIDDQTLDYFENELADIRNTRRNE
jgi:hypothetical protein